MEVLLSVEEYRAGQQISYNETDPLPMNLFWLPQRILLTDVNDDHFMIHALSREGMEELREGEMQRRIRKLGY